MVDKIKALDSKAENRLAQDHPPHQRTHTLALYEDPTCFTNASRAGCRGKGDSGIDSLGGSLGEERCG